MARRKHYAVEFVINRIRIVEILIEQLSYAGLLKEIQKTEREIVLVMYPPRSVDELIWATHNAKRMRSFGIDTQVVEI